MHPEQLFLACLASEDVDVRARAVARVTLLRQSTQGAVEPPKAGKKDPTNPFNVRIFEQPMPVYTATSFDTMIDWASEQVTEPPYLRKYSTAELKIFEQSPLVLEIPSNSQFVERLKLVTRNATRATSPTLRDGLNHATLRSRRQRPKVETKAHFST